MKYTDFDRWVWRWHVIGGLVSLPFVVMLSITGGIYLFRDNVETPVIEKIKDVEILSESITYDEQLKIATQAFGAMPNSVVVPLNTGEATEFVKGRFSHKKSVFVDPYSGEVSGNFKPQDTWMYTVRKLHGELLGGKVGTKIIELIASWMVVLLITGIFIFWPKKELGWKGFFKIRLNAGRRMLYRDLHAVGGFWLSALLLLVLAGGLPWTDVFGENFKTLQKVTNTGFPKEWFAVGITSEVAEKPLTLDKMLAIARNQNLEGVLTLDFPKNEVGVFSVSNSTFPLENQKKIHFDQYSGKQLKVLNWSDVGVLMRGRMWVMAFHQGQLGQWNFVLMLCVAFGLTMISLAALFSLKKRKWKIPTVPSTFKARFGVILLLIVLSILLPLFGISLVLIFISFAIKQRLGKKS